MGTKLPSCPPSAAAEFSAVRIMAAPLSPDSAFSQMAAGKDGGVAIFCGVVRDTEEGRPIESITYEAYEALALKEMLRIAGEAESRWPVRVSIQHRVGVVRAGETSLLVSASGAHREEAFAACRFAVDEVKQRVPIWKVSFGWCD